MDLDRKIGRLFSVPARALTDDVIRHVRDNHVGGVIWFQSTTDVVSAANAHLRELAGEPLLISADLESGMGMRFTDAVWWPPAMALAATGDPALAEEQARVTAREALAIGVNHILAPVCDVNVDPANPVINTRSFGEDPHDVARYVEALVRGIQSEGALATAKHFPGHGDTHVDSHRALPVLDASRERLERVELVPFRAAIGAGVGSVMIGHLAVPSLDATPVPVRESFENVWGTEHHEVTRGGTMPATLSAPVIASLRALGFEGLIVTDAMDMGGLAAHFDPGEAAVRALEAGEDQVLYSADTDAAIAAVRAAVVSGRLPLARIEEAYERVRSAANGGRGFSPPPPGRGGLKPRPPSALGIAQRSITLVRDTRGLLPLTAKKLAVATFTDEPLDHLLTGNSTPDAADVLLLHLAMRPKSGAGRIAVPEEARRLAEKHADKTIAVSFGSPYILRELGDVSAFVCAWGIQPVLQIAATNALLGKAEFTGRLPVTL
ncbi:MAG TPA: glycoside hydrolase family 3 N-terminal domain-containing protein [Thermoanaerobaculia bacterium]|nr:glycoside hydrolase family 3 N-terminal domain-containing protein [Thermoanaerobaculia bacterium]